MLWLAAVIILSLFFLIYCSSTIIIIIIRILRVFQTCSDWWFSLKSEWPQVSSAHQDSSQYSDLIRLDDLVSSSDLHLIDSLFLDIWDYSQDSSYDWYHCHHTP